jgi:hypothetical protein
VQTRPSRQLRCLLFSLLVSAQVAFGFKHHPSGHRTRNVLNPLTNPVPLPSSSQPGDHRTRNVLNPLNNPIPPPSPSLPSAGLPRRRTLCRLALGFDHQPSDHGPRCVHLCGPRIGRPNLDRPGGAMEGRDCLADVARRPGDGAGGVDGGDQDGQHERREDGMD